jgi:hypothetical protein
VGVVIGADIGDRREGQGEVRVLRHRVLVHLQRELEVLARQAPRVAAAAQVQVIGLQVVGRLGGQGLLLLRRELDAQRRGDLLGDLVLHLEDVLHLAVVALRPEREVGVGVHQLRRDPQAGARPAQAAREDVGGVQLLADLRRGDRLVAVDQDGGAGIHLHPLDLRQLRDDVLGDPVPQVLVLLGPAQVLEIEDGDRFFGGLVRAPLRVGEIRALPPARVDVPLEPQQVGLELGRRLVTQVPVLLERLVEDPLQLGRHRGVRLGERPRRAVQDRLEDEGLRVSRKGEGPGRHLVEHRPDREQVGARVGQLPARLLGRHVVDGPQHRPRHGQLVAAAHRLGLGRGAVAVGLGAHRTDLGQTEVEDLALAARVDHQVGRLQVPVDDPFRMGRLQRVRDLDSEVEKLADLEGLAPHALRQGLPVEQLHDDEMPPLVLLDRVHGADAGVVERGGGPGLPLEPLEDRRVALHLVGEELDRHPPAEARVLRLEDDSHAARAEPAQDLVMRHRAADLDFHLWTLPPARLT